MKFLRRKIWCLQVFCGHCGYRLRQTTTKGLSGYLVPIGHIVNEKETCPQCGKVNDWWLQLEPVGKN